MYKFDILCLYRIEMDFQTFYENPTNSLFTGQNIENIAVYDWTFSLVHFNVH